MHQRTSEKDQNKDNEGTEGGIKKKLNRELKQVENRLIEVNNGGTTLGKPDPEWCTREEEVQQRLEPRNPSAAPTEPPNPNLPLWQGVCVALIG